MNLDRILKQAVQITKENTPAILTSCAVVGTISTALLTAKASSQATLILDENRVVRVKEELGPATLKDEFGMVWKLYIPPVLSGAATVGCILASHSVNRKRHAAAIAAYSITDTAFREYRDKIIEEIGTAKEQKFREEIGVDHIKKNPLGDREVVVMVDGETLFHDSMSGRYFKSDTERVRQAVNNINSKALVNDYVSLNEFYQEIGLSPTVLGDEMGWRSDRLLEITFGATISDDGRPALDIDYLVAPLRGYYRGHA